MSAGPVRYARNGDVRLAYRVFGDTGPTVVWVPGWVVGNVDTIDEPESPYAHLIDVISRELRLVAWDRRGTGLSDPSSHLLSVDERVDDLGAVLDAIGDERPSLTGTGEGGTVAIVYTAMNPERVKSLALYGTAARFSQDPPDHPWGFTPREVATRLAEIDEKWGEGALADVFSGSGADIPGVRAKFGKLQRSIMSPGMARLWWRATMDVDVRPVLGSIRVPTLVLARPGDRLAPVEAAAAMAAAIPDARFHMMSPGAHNAFDVLHELTEHILRFFAESAGAPADERVLKTVLFTDIVGSTERLSAAGDAHWRFQLDNHDSVVDHVLSRHRGVRANHTEDGVFAIFDAPTRATRCALELVPTLAAHGLPIRAGVHVGECERRGNEWSGMAVHTGARIGALAGAGDVLASRTVRDLSAGSGLLFESLGLQSLKGLPEDIEIFRVTAS